MDSISKKEQNGSILYGSILSHYRETPNLERVLQNPTFSMHKKNLRSV
jgi:hypothetical protein